MLAARYTLGRLTEQQHDFLRRTVAVDIRIATSALHVLGVAVLDAGTDRDRADESAELTDLGRYAIRRLRGMAQPADRIDYEYDFGDGWEHALVVEARETAQDGGVYPACVAGEGACPPEDCGGSPGFAEFKAALAGPPGTERDALLQWAGGDYDPGRFSLSAVNAAVSAIIWKRVGSKGAVSAGC